MSSLLQELVSDIFDKKRHHKEIPAPLRNRFYKAILTEYYSTWAGRGEQIAGFIVYSAGATVIYRRDPFYTNRQNRNRSGSYYFLGIQKETARNTLNEIYLETQIDPYFDIDKACVKILSAHSQHTVRGKYKTYNQFQYTSLFLSFKFNLMWYIRNKPIGAYVTADTPITLDNKGRLFFLVSDHPDHLDKPTYLDMDGCDLAYNKRDMSIVVNTPSTFKQPTIKEGLEEIKSILTNNVVVFTDYLAYKSPDRICNDLRDGVLFHSAKQNAIFEFVMVLLDDITRRGYTDYLLLYFDPEYRNLIKGIAEGWVSIMAKIKSL